MSAKVTCKWCYGNGIYKSYADSGMRRVMEKGPWGKPMHPREQVYQCEMCQRPATAPVCPTKFVRVN